MAVCDLLCEDGIVCNLVPIDLVLGQHREFLRYFFQAERILTSLRFFCCRMANRKRHMALSLFEDMVMVLTGLPRSNNRMNITTKIEDGVRFKLSAKV